MLVLPPHGRCQGCDLAMTTSKPQNCILPNFAYEQTPSTCTPQSTFVRLTSILHGNTCAPPPPSPSLAVMPQTLNLGSPDLQVMKMVMTLLAPASGKVHYQQLEGAALSSGDLIARLDLDNPEAAQQVTTPPPSPHPECMKANERGDPLLDSVGNLLVCVCC